MFLDSCQVKHCCISKLTLFCEHRSLVLNKGMDHGQGEVGKRSVFTQSSRVACYGEPPLVLFLALV